jgi:hypothetical protein
MNYGHLFGPFVIDKTWFTGVKLIVATAVTTITIFVSFAYRTTILLLEDGVWFFLFAKKNVAKFFRKNIVT